MFWSEKFNMCLSVYVFTSDIVFSTLVVLAWAGLLFVSSAGSVALW